MIKVTIGSSTRTDSEITESWVTQQINRRRRDDAPVCVVVEIRGGEVNATLSTPDCGNAPPGGKKPNPHELRVFELWKKHHLNSPDFTGGNLIAFLKQFERL